MHGLTFSVACLPLLFQFLVYINWMDRAFNQERKGPEYFRLFLSFFHAALKKRFHFLKWNKKHLYTVAVEGKFLSVSAG